jgi:hypothetical protein
MEIVASRMECRIETGDMGHIGRELSQRRHCPKPIGQMQGRKFAQGFKIILNVLVNANRRRITRAAMHDAVANPAAVPQHNSLAFDFSRCSLQRVRAITRHLSDQYLNKSIIENRKLQ